MCAVCIFHARSYFSHLLSFVLASERKEVAVQGAQSIRCGSYRAHCKQHNECVWIMAVDNGSISHKPWSVLAVSSERVACTRHYQCMCFWRLWPCGIGILVHVSPALFMTSQQVRHGWRECCCTDIVSCNWTFYTFISSFTPSTRCYPRYGCQGHVATKTLHDAHNAETHAISAALYYRHRGVRYNTAVFLSPAHLQWRTNNRGIG